MEISAIQATAAASALPDRRGHLDIPTQQLLDAFAEASVGDSGRRLLLDTLSAWGSVAARVVGQNANGLTLLEVAGARIALRLPEPRAAGETVMLSISDAHRLPSIVPRTDTEFSNIARLLARLSAPTDATPQPIAAGTSLSSTPTHADSLAAALMRSVAESGLFYESHLARWVDNDYRLSDMKREPQAQVRLGGNQDLGPGGLPGEQPAVVAERLLPVLRQQLTALETQTIPWSGMLWPGQHGEIEIRQDLPPETEETEPAGHPAVWITRINLNLPRLGRVETLIALSAGRVALSIAGDSAHAAAKLEASSTRLEAALLARGIQPEALLVRHREA